MRYHQDRIAKEFFYATKSCAILSFLLKNAFDRVRISQGGAAQIFMNKIFDSGIMDLRKSLSNFEEYQVLTKSCLIAEHQKVIYIDPIVGKINFGHGRFGWGTLVAFFDNKICTAAAFYEPIFEEIFNVSHKGGSFINRRRIRYSGEPIANYDIGCEFLTCLYKLIGRVKKNQCTFENTWLLNAAKLFCDEAYADYKSIDMQLDFIVPSL